MKGQESMRQPVCRQYSPYWFMGNKRDRETEIMKGINEKTTLFKVSGIILKNSPFTSCSKVTEEASTKNKFACCRGDAADAKKL